MRLDFQILQKASGPKHCQLDPPLLCSLTTDHVHKTSVSLQSTFITLTDYFISDHVRNIRPHIRKQS